MLLALLSLEYGEVPGIRPQLQGLLALTIPIDTSTPVAPPPVTGGVLAGYPEIHRHRSYAQLMALWASGVITESEVVGFLALAAVN